MREGSRLGCKYLLKISLQRTQKPSTNYLRQLLNFFQANIYMMLFFTVIDTTSTESIITVDVTRIRPNHFFSKRFNPVQNV